MTFVWITSYLFVFVLGGILTMLACMYLFPANKQIDQLVSDALDYDDSPVAETPFTPTILKYKNS